MAGRQLDLRRFIETFRVRSARYGQQRDVDVADIVKYYKPRSALQRAALQSEVTRMRRGAFAEHDAPEEFGDLRSCTQRVCGALSYLRTWLRDIQQDMFLWANLSNVIGSSFYVFADFSRSYLINNNTFKNSVYPISAVQMLLSAMFYLFSWQGANPFPSWPALWGEYCNIGGSIIYVATSALYIYEPTPPITVTVILLEALANVIFVASSLNYLFAWLAAVDSTNRRRGCTPVDIEMWANALNVVPAGLYLVSSTAGIWYHFARVERSDGQYVPPGPGGNINMGGDSRILAWSNSNGSDLHGAAFGLDLGGGGVDGWSRDWYGHGNATGTLPGGPLIGAGGAEPTAASLASSDAGIVAVVLTLLAAVARRFRGSTGRSRNQPQAGAFSAAGARVAAAGGRALRSGSPSIPSDTNPANNIPLLGTLYKLSAWADVLYLADSICFVVVWWRDAKEELEGFKEEAAKQAEARAERAREKRRKVAAAIAAGKWPGSRTTAGADPPAAALGTGITGGPSPQAQSIIASATSANTGGLRSSPPLPIGGAAGVARVSPLLLGARNRLPASAAAGPFALSQVVRAQAGGGAPQAVEDDEEEDDEEDEDDEGDQDIAALVGGEGTGAAGAASAAAVDVSARGIVIASAAGGVSGVGMLTRGNAMSDVRDGLSASEWQRVMREYGHAGDEASNSSSKHDLLPPSPIMSDGTRLHGRTKPRTDAGAHVDDSARRSASSMLLGALWPASLSSAASSFAGSRLDPSSLALAAPLLDPDSVHASGADVSAVGSIQAGSMTSLARSPLLHGAHSASSSVSGSSSTMAARAGRVVELSARTSLPGSAGGAGVVAPASGLALALRSDASGQEAARPPGATSPPAAYVPPSIPQAPPRLALPPPPAVLKVRASSSGSASSPIDSSGTGTGRPKGARKVTVDELLASANRLQRERTQAARTHGVDYAYRPTGAEFDDRYEGYQVFGCCLRARDWLTRRRLGWLCCSCDATGARYVTTADAKPVMTTPGSPIPLTPAALNLLQQSTRSPPHLALSATSSSPAISAMMLQ